MRKVLDRQPQSSTHRTRSTCSPFDQKGCLQDYKHSDKHITTNINSIVSHKHILKDNVLNRARVHLSTCAVKNTIGAIYQSHLMTKSQWGGIGECTGANLSHRQGCVQTTIPKDYWKSKEWHAKHFIAFFFWKEKTNKFLSHFRCIDMLWGVWVLEIQEVRGMVEQYFHWTEDGAWVHITPCPFLEISRKNILCKTRLCRFAFFGKIIQVVEIRFR